MSVEIIPLKSQYTVAGLAVSTAAQANAEHSTGLKSAFLAKHLKLFVVLEDPDALDTLIFGMARGIASVTEIKNAIEMVTLDRDEQDQADVREVLHETVTRLTCGTAGDSVQMEIDVSLGGGKGIPFSKDRGWQLFVYNAGANDQVAGSIIRWNGYLTGVWM